MEVIVEGNEVRIKGKNCNKKWYLKIYVDENEGRDRYCLSVIEPTFERGCLPTIYMTPDNVILQNNGNKEIIL